MDTLQLYMAFMRLVLLTRCAYPVSTDEGYDDGNEDWEYEEEDI